MSKTNFEVHMKHLKSPGEMKLMINLHNFSELWNLFSEVPMAFRKCIKDFHILIIILVQDICPLKTEIAQFPIGFCLNL